MSLEMTMIGRLEEIVLRRQGCEWLLGAAWYDSEIQGGMMVTAAAR